MAIGNPASPDDFITQAGDFWRERGGRLTFVRETICKRIAVRGSAFEADMLIFVIASSMFLVALLFIHLQVPRVEPRRL